MIDITEADFSIDEVVKKARSGDVGAIVTFLGTVRNDDIKSMELEAPVLLPKVTADIVFNVPTL